MEHKKPAQYDHKAIETKWQEKWQADGLYSVKDKVEGKENYYTLVEFSYPSGNLHTGHWYAFSVPDIFARYKRMQGYNVLYPMGFDAFGLPAENAAIKLGADPKVWTKSQMEKMRSQLRSMGAMFDWDREVVSCSPEYYQWTQWMFNQFLKNDLVYRAATMVNWCPKDQTILANEQVVDGKCERCGSEVVQREQPQWMLRITQYADQLIDDLEKLDWPEEIKAAQRNWIGRSEGSEIEFKITASSRSIKVFTTRADTLFGVTYVVLAPEHTLVQEFFPAIENKEEVQAYIDTTKKKLELERQQSKEKTGVELKGITAINPANGEEVPVWIADYVLVNYGTGAVMAVPAHDERDFEFAKKYNLPLKTVIAEVVGDSHLENNIRREVKAIIVKNGKLLMLTNGSEYGLPGGGIEGEETPQQALIREIKEELGYVNVKITHSLGQVYRYYFSKTEQKNKVRHLYGFIVEIVDEAKIPVKPETFPNEPDQPILLDFDTAIEEITTSGGSYNNILVQRYLSGKYESFCKEGILVDSGKFSKLHSEEVKQKITEFVGGKMVNTYRLRDWGISRQRYWGTPIPIVYDPQGAAHPVPDEHLPWLLPTDVDHTPDGTAPLARSRELFERTESIFGKGWTPEVETMDTFVDSSWYFYRYLDNKNENEFATKQKMEAWMPIDLYMGGAEHTTMHLLYSRFWVKALYDLGFVPQKEAYKIRRNRGLILGPDGNKMSKSKGNVIDPDEIVERLGADTVRLYLAFLGPYGVTINYPWDPNGVVGVRRFLERVWKLAAKIDQDKKVCRTDPLVHKTIKGVGEDIEAFKFNTAIAKMMILLNALEKEEAIVRGSYTALLRLLAPFAPHITEELWKELGEKESIHLATWPRYEESLIVEDTHTIGVQINGKVRAQLTIAANATVQEIEDSALALPKVIEHLAGSKPKKVIVVPGRIVNIVL